MRTKLAFLLTITLLSSPLHSETGVPGSQFTSFAGFELGRQTLTQVSNVLGPASIVESGDAGDYLASVCYRVPDGVIHFDSGEMGGRDHLLLGFRLSRPDANAAGNCGSWPSSRPMPRLAIGGLSPGMSRTAFAKAVGIHVEWTGDLALASFPSRRGDVDITISVKARFRDDKLEELSTFKIESL
jgi:hypothetical protein